MAAKKHVKTTPKGRASSAPAPEAPQDSTKIFKVGFFKENRAQVLVLMGISMILYGVTVGFGYLQDDQVVIWDNDFVQKGFAGLRDIFSSDSLLGYYKDAKTLYEGGRYRPLPLASFAVEIGLFGKNQPGIAHSVNVLLYGFTGVLLYRILVALFSAPSEKKGGAVWQLNLPFWASVFFMLHPLHTEVVANIKGRDEILALLSALTALYAAMRYAEAGESRWLAFTGIGFFLGLLAKENVATFIAVIPLTLWMFTKVSLGRNLKIALVLLGATALYVFVRFKALGYMVRPENPLKELVLNPFMGMSVGEKFATIFLTLGWYLKLLVFPHPLTIDYYPYHVPKVNWEDWRPLASLGIYLLAGVWAVWRIFFSRTARDKTAGNKPDTRIAAYGILVYLLTLSVVTNIFVSTSTFMNERYLYMPSVGYCLLMAWLFTRVLPTRFGKSGPSLAAGLAGIVALLFAWRVYVRVPDWGGDGSKLVEKAVRVSKDSYRANYYYAAMLFKERYEKQLPATSTARAALLDEISTHLDRSLEINPGYRTAGTMKVLVATAKYRENPQPAALLAILEDLISKQPYNGDMLVQLIAVLKAMKGADPNIYNRFCHRIGYDFYYRQKGDLNGAAEFLKLALDNFSQDPNALQGLMEIYTAMGDQQKAADMQQRLQTLQGQ